MGLVLNRDDIDFLLFDWLKVEDLFAHPRYAGHDRATVAAVLDLAEKMAEDVFAPANKACDHVELVLTPGGEVVLPGEIAVAMLAFAQSGLLAGSFAAEHGGMQLPFVVDKAAFAFLQAASPGISGYALLAGAAANLLIEHGSPQQIAHYALPLIEGRTFGTMCLSEPQAGSSLGDIRTRAVPEGGGRYRLFGNKMWISGGNHSLGESITHLVLARIEGAAPGVKGLSLFIVPRDLAGTDAGTQRNDVVVAGLNHKMGQRGTVNTLLNFGEGAHLPDGSAGAVGFIVGSEGEGLKAMFTMMNEARIGVGTSAAAIGYTGYLHALDYARTRPQGRLRTSRDTAAPQIPIIEHLDVRRMLLIQKAYVEGALALNLFCASMVDRIRCAGGDAAADDRLLLDLLTPIAKSWPSQYCLKANELAIQVHGGYGYTRDYMVEQFYRDNRLNPIHEGTHGIHAIDLLGRKVVMANGRALDLFAQMLRASCGKAEIAGGEASEHAAAVESLLRRVLDVTAQLHSATGDTDPLANASAYLEVVGTLAVGWVWLEQLLALGLREDGFVKGKTAAARYFRRWDMVRMHALIDALAERDRTLQDLQPAWL